MTDRELMQQALEALVKWEVSTRRWESHGLWSPAITALRERLAQPEKKPVSPPIFCPRCGKPSRTLEDIHTCTPPKKNT